MSLLNRGSNQGLDQAVDQELDKGLDQLLAEQQVFFDAGKSRGFAFRREQLLRLRNAVKANEESIMTALAKDLHKPRTESYGSEIGLVYQDLNHALTHLKSWMKPRRVPTPLTLQPASSYILREPYGRTLVISPWNYPFQLALSPLVGAIAAGNCTVLKPSELAPHTAAVITKLIKETFPQAYVAAVSGGPEVGQALLRQRWDYIFFTGSTALGRIVARSAAEHLTPITLELGGKSPCIVDSMIDVDLAARRIAWGKFYNAGQTCIAPDYLLVHTKVKTALLERLTEYVSRFFGPEPAKSPDFARIINTHHFHRLQRLLQGRSPFVGGDSDENSLYIAPTIIDNVRPADPLMQAEIFGPILPVLAYTELNEAIATVKALPKPLSLYLFTTHKETERRILAELTFGGGCINNTLLHFANPNLPFGGVGESGMGHYHGKYSFDTFTYPKSIVKSSFFLDIPLKYQPYKEKLKWIRMLLK